MVAENLFVDESQGAIFEHVSVYSHGWSRNLHVACSGPKMDVALDTLAKTLPSAYPSRNTRH